MTTVRATGNTDALFFFWVFVPFAMMGVAAIGTRIDYLMNRYSHCSSSFFFFFKESGTPRDLPSSPTRRSSDLSSYRLVRGTGRFDVANRLRKLPTDEKESVYFTFPFALERPRVEWEVTGGVTGDGHPLDRKSTRLNSSHSQISYAVFCLKKNKP